MSHLFRKTRPLPLRESLLSGAPSRRLEERTDIEIEARLEAARRGGKPKSATVCFFEVVQYWTAVCLGMVHHDVVKSRHIFMRGGCAQSRRCAFKQR